MHWSNLDVRTAVLLRFKATPLKPLHMAMDEHALHARTYACLMYKVGSAGTYVQPFTCRGRFELERNPDWRLSFNFTSLQPEHCVLSYSKIAIATWSLASYSQTHWPIDCSGYLKEQHQQQQNPLSSIPRPPLDLLAWYLLVHDQLCSGCSKPKVPVQSALNTFGGSMSPRKETASRCCLSEFKHILCRTK